MNNEKEIVLITGCSGLLGSKIIEKFSEKYRIIGLDIIKPEEANLGEDYYYMDITNETSINNTLRHIKERYGEKIASVIHLAAYYSFSQQDWDLYKKITIDGTKKILKVLEIFDVEQFIFSSTQLIYKPCKVGEKISENSEIRPAWEYPKSKVITEEEILKRHGNTPTCIMRISGIYDDFCHSVPISQQIKRIYENRLQKFFFSGSVKHGVPFLHIDDFIEALYATVIKRKEIPNELYLLLGEDKTYSYDQIQRSLGKLILGKEFHTYCVPKFLAKIGSWILNHIPFYPKPFIKPWMIDISDDHYELDISYTKKILGWEPENDLMQTLPKMVSSLKKDPKEWYKEHSLKK